MLTYQVKENGRNSATTHMGVDNSGSVVGTSAFTSDWNTLAHKLSENLRVRIQVHEIRASEGRVLVFTIPKHSPGQPVQVSGGSGEYTYPIRDGESLVEMNPTTLQEIFAETDPDWSAEIAPDVTSHDLDERALTEYRRRWANATNSPERESVNFEQMLNDLSLRREEGITNAAVLSIVERVGSGRGVNYILSRRYYQYTNSMGQHTRLSGLNSAVKKNIIIEHLRRNGRVTNAELQVAMPDMEMKAISNLLSRMSKQNIIQHVGTMRSGYWELVNPPRNEQSSIN